MRRRRAAALDDIWASLPQFTAASGQLYMAGKQLQLKGVSWFGAEGVGMVPDGLWAHNASYYFQFLTKNGFNAVRIPFALDNVVANRQPDAKMLRSAPELQGLRYLDILERICDYAAMHGMLVLLDLHRLDSATWPDPGLWYSRDVDLSTVQEIWGQMAERFCHRWNTLGADLFNEPHGAKWTDWVKAATSLGNSVLSKCPRWLVFVEGVAHEGTKDTAVTRAATSTMLCW